jgi:hypothetical protein
MIYTDTLKYDMAGRRRKSKSLKGEVYKKFKPTWKPFVSENRVVRRDEGVVYKSADMFERNGNTERKEPQKYTGTLIKGIATMHKSNAIPVTNEEQAKDLASMRR